MAKFSLSWITSVSLMGKLALGWQEVGGLVTVKPGHAQGQHKNGPPLYVGNVSLSSWVTPVLQRKSHSLKKGIKI